MDQIFIDDSTKIINGLTR